jgi:hypothetical protein
MDAQAFIVGKLRARRRMVSVLPAKQRQQLLTQRQIKRFEDLQST